MSQAETALQPDLSTEIAPTAPFAESGPSASDAGGLLTIDLSAIAANWDVLGRRSMPSECGAVIKAERLWVRH